MANGDDAAAAGYDLVQNTGDQGLVRNGADEINKTRDYIARLKATVPVGSNNYRSASGISSGTAAPTGGNDGDIYFKIIS